MGSGTPSSVNTVSETIGFTQHPHFLGILLELWRHASVSLVPDFQQGLFAPDLTVSAAFKILSSPLRTGSHTIRNTETFPGSLHVSLSFSSRTFPFFLSPNPILHPLHDKGQRKEEPRYFKELDRYVYSTASLNSLINAASGSMTHCSLFVSGLIVA